MRLMRKYSPAFCFVVVLTLLACGSPSVANETRLNNDIPVSGSEMPTAIVANPNDRHLVQLHPQLRDYVLAQAWYQDGLDSNDALLLQFLVDATVPSQGANAQSRWPMATVPELMYKPMGPDRLISILKEGSFRYFSLSGKTILIAVSSYAPMDEDFCQALLNIVDRVGPASDLLGGRYPFPYLHIDIHGMLINADRADGPISPGGRLGQGPPAPVASSMSSCIPTALRMDTPFGLMKGLLS